MTEFQEKDEKVSRVSEINLSSRSRPSPRRPRNLSPSRKNSVEDDKVSLKSRLSKSPKRNEFDDAAIAFDKKENILKQKISKKEEDNFIFSGMRVPHLPN